MNNFSISQMAQYAGLKPHTIRIWEQRYNVIQPHRSPGNTRYYDDIQLRRLLNIVTLSAAGYRVSDLAVMKDEQLFLLIREQQSGDLPASYEYYVSSLINAGLQFDEPTFDKILSHCFLKFSVRATYMQIIYPVLQRVGLLWSADQLPPSSEHFISNLFRQKLFTAIDALPAGNNNNSDTWLCFLPEDEFHEMGLLFANWLIRSKGHKVIYLGSNVPVASLLQAVKATKCTHMLTFLVKNNSVENYQEVIRAITGVNPRIKLFVATGSGSFNTKPKANTRFVHSVEELEEEL